MADIYENLQTLTVAKLDGGVDLTGRTLTEARGISEDGLTIVGHGNNPSGNTEVWMATIPEPSTLLLLGLGCVAV
ncbi:MAG: PEP-CTERM sorting domain-containing protein [Phycisphaerae bacterium]|nr:PEP-CTERM sorting domain-containing protein [Phycisphaerae bacterium]